MNIFERQELEACLFGKPPYERYGAIEPEVFVELYPVFSKEVRGWFSIQFWDLECTTFNQRELLWNCFRGDIPQKYQMLAEYWKTKPESVNTNKYDIDINQIKLDNLYQLFQFPDQIVEFFEKKGHPKNLEMYSEILVKLFKTSLEREYFGARPDNPLTDLLRLIERLPLEHKERVYSQILNSLISEKTGSDDLKAFLQIAPLLPDSIKPLAESVARNLHREWIVIVLQQAKDIPQGGMHPYQSPIYRWLGKRACKLLENLPIEEREELLEASIQSLWTRYRQLNPLDPSFFTFPLPTKEHPVEGSFNGAKREEGGSGGFDRGSPLSLPSPKILYKVITDILFKQQAPPVKAKPPLKIELPKTDKPIEKQIQPKEIFINSGFVEFENIDKIIEKHTPLKTDRDYYFWLKIGKELEERIETGEAQLPSDLPEGALLQVTLFPFKGELKIIDDDVGWMRLRLVREQMTGIVEKKGTRFNLHSDDQRLLFGVRTPEKSGDYRLRCNIYYTQVLLQSSIVTVRVEEKPEPMANVAQYSIVDYSIGPTLNAPHLSSLQSQDLSLLLNDNGDGTHSLRILTKNETKQNIDLDEHGLKGMILDAREAYRQATWGDKEPYTAGKRERYGAFPGLKEFTKDLTELAIQGYKLYDSLLGMVDLPEEFMEEISKNHKHIEFIIRDETKTSSYIVPVALFYDHPIDSQIEHKLCSTFLDAFNNKKPLEDTPCFQGACPSFGDLGTVCPSGFWGYRHSIGLPTTRISEINYTQTCETNPRVCACINKVFTTWSKHLSRLKERAPNTQFHEAYDRETALNSVMKEGGNVLYFYCHGDRINGTTYLRLGARDAPKIAPEDLRSHNIKWNDPNPLVIINGCNTAALDAEQALNFVQRFLKYSNAAGVIGTDITVFESLASKFAEGCIKRFLEDGEPIGEAVRKTRLELLQEGNPLGLVYVPYVHDGLKLVKK